VSPEKIKGRQLKRNILELLKQENAEHCIVELCRLPARKVVNPLFSFLCSLDELVKWRAVSAMGAVVSNLFKTNPESARVIMRRFIWQLNDESGGIGWGCGLQMNTVASLFRIFGRTGITWSMKYCSAERSGL
jgi:hypothetical protein